MERLQCELSCIVGVKVAQSKGKITKIETYSGHKQTIFTKYFVRTGNPRYLGKKQNTSLFTILTKYGRGKLNSFETEIDAQAYNVSY